MGDESCNPALGGNWGGAALIISVVCGIIGSIGLLRDRRFTDAAFVWLMYLGPPIIVFGTVGPLTRFLQQSLMLTNTDQTTIGFSVVLLFAPILFLWIGWLFVGGYVVLNGDIDVSRIIKSHLTRDSLKYKAIGLAMMLVAVVIYVGTVALTNPSAIRILPFIVSLLLYFRGAFPFVFPEFDPIHGA